MRRKILQTILVTASAVVVLTMAAFLTLGLTYPGLEAESTPINSQDPSVEAYNQHNLIRFHVIANSDSETDQALKRSVRDVVVQKMAPEFSQAKNISEARAIAASHLEEIQIAAEEEVARWGGEYPVAVQLGNFDFPIKSYGKLTLPAGNYEAVRVIIGQGQGANWWCVLFPPMCFLDVSQNVQQASGSGVLSATPDRKKVQVRFKFLELFGLVDY